MRIRARRTVVWQQPGMWLLLLVTWQLTGCSAVRWSSESYGPYSMGKDAAETDRAESRHLGAGQLPPYGPPDSAAPNASNDFSVSNPRVNGFVETYQTRLRGFYQGALQRSGRYVPRMTHVIRGENLPPELAYLPMIESGFRTHAVSRAGAVGPWQFIRATGKRYGLRIDNYVDERRDPVKSTYAAARYLKDLYAQFGDWHLSLAAYNTGEMNIARIIERDKVDDYWQMIERGSLPAETSNFVPQFLAALQIAQDPEAYGFEAPNDSPDPYDLVHIDRSVSLKTVAKLTNISVTEMAELNPALHRGVTPPKGYTVRVPHGTKEIVETALARMRHDARELVPDRGSNTAIARHVLRKGETLAAVAKRYRVSVASLMKANGIRNARRVATGKLLRIPGGAPASRVSARKATGKAVVRLASKRAR